MFLWIICGFVAGMLIQTLRLVLAKQQYQSEATLMVMGPGLREYERRNDQEQGLASMFAATVVETLASAEISRRASDRVRALNPELKECGVTVRCSQLKDSGLFKVFTIGEDKVYIRHFLNAVLDEFVAFRQSYRSQREAKFFSSLFDEFEKQRTEAVRNATTQNSRQTVDKAYEQWLTKLGQFKTASEDSSHEAIFERAKPPTEAYQEWSGPLLKGAVTGLVGGFVLFYLVSSFNALREILKER